MCRSTLPLVVKLLEARIESFFGLISYFVMQANDLCKTATFWDSYCTLCSELG